MPNSSDRALNVSKKQDTRRGRVPGSSPNGNSLLHCKFVTKVFSCKKKDKDLRPSCLTHVIRALNVSKRWGIGKGGVLGLSLSVDSLLHCKFVTKVISCKKKKK